MKRSDRLQGLDMAVIDSHAARCEPKPGAAVPCNSALGDIDVAGALELRHLLGQHRVADLDTVANQTEFRALNVGQRRHDRQAHRVKKQVIQVVPRVHANHARRSLIAPRTIGAATRTAAGNQYSGSPMNLGVPTARTAP